MMKFTINGSHILTNEIEYYLNQLSIELKDQGIKEVTINIGEHVKFETLSKALKPHDLDELHSILNFVLPILLLKKEYSISFLVDLLNHYQTLKVESDNPLLELIYKNL